MLRWMYLSFPKDQMISILPCRIPYLLPSSLPNPDVPLVSVLKIPSQPRRLPEYGFATGGIMPRRTLRVHPIDQFRHLSPLKYFLRTHLLRDLRPSSSSHASMLKVRTAGIYSRPWSAVNGRHELTRRRDLRVQLQSQRIALMTYAAHSILSYHSDCIREEYWT